MTQRTKYRLLLGTIVLFHTIGLVGLQTTYRETFFHLSWMNLLLSAICLLLSFRFSGRLLVDVLVVGAAGFLAEFIGVHTGWLFGDYHYGSVLGRKLADVPLIIAVNWVILSFAALAFVVQWKVPVVVKALVSAGLMTALDFLIEPVAMEAGFWSWKNGTVPVYNYVSWFLVAFLLHYYLLKRRTPQQNPVAIGLFLVLVVFFGTLNAC